MAKDVVPTLKVRDPVRTKAQILDVATLEFARLGYFGARVDEIAAKTATTKRMIYYYFTDKEGLFSAVLEHAYEGIRDAEQALELDRLEPEEALAALVRHTFDYHDANPHLARLIAAENNVDAVHLLASRGHAGKNRPIVALIGRVLDRGRESGAAQREVDPLDVHLTMVGLALYRVTNHETVFATFGVHMDSKEFKERQIGIVTEMLQRWLATPDASPVRRRGSRPVAPPRNLARGSRS